MSAHLDPESFLLGIAWGLLAAAAILRVAAWVGRPQVTPPPAADPAAGAVWDVLADARRILEQDDAAG